MARDGGEPSLTDSTIVYINVNRNNYRPRFTTENSTISICEETSLGDIFEQVEATDSDATVCIEYT